MTRITRQDLAAVIGERTLHISDKRKLALTLAAYLLEERRTGELESLVRDIMQHRLDHGVVEANVVSAHDLPAKVLGDIKSLMSDEYPRANEIILDNNLDEAVVGGVRVELPNEQLNMTVRAKLDTFKRLTSGGTT